MTEDTGKTPAVSPNRHTRSSAPQPSPSGPLRGTLAEREVAERVAAQLHEPYVGQIVRLVQIFGTVRVEESEREAHRIFAAAQEQGAEAYAKSSEGSLVATKAGEPRTLGGVFFALMRRHAESLGINWFGLFPPPPWQKKNPARNGSDSASSQIEAAKSELGTVVSGASSGLSTLPPKVPAAPPKTAESQAIISQSPLPPSPVGETHTIPKPARLKTTVVGTLSEAPKFDAASGLVELRFRSEMSPELPKGLPNLGPSRIVAFCTRKQFDKVANATSLTPQTRYIIEGEAVPAVSRDLLPFLKVVALRVTTPEMDQLTREKKGESPQAAM